MTPLTVGHMVQPLHTTSTNLTPIPNITGIAVAFDWDHKHRGHSVGLHSQGDVVDLYGYRAHEELEESDVRTYFVDRRRVTIAEGFRDMPAGFVPLFLSCDWITGKMRQNNASIVEFSHPDLYRMAERLCESLGEWGRAYVYGHRVMKPLVVNGERPFVRIKPFSLNGPHADEYLKRLDKLGEEIGRAIGGYLKDRGEGLRRG